MKVIYVSGPYRSLLEHEVFENIMRARTIAERLWVEGWAVICPHLNTLFMGDLIPHAYFIDGDIEMVKRCDAIYMMKDWKSSAGACLELASTRETNIEVIYEVEE